MVCERLPSSMMTSTLACAHAIAAAAHFADERLRFDDHGKPLRARRGGREQAGDDDEVTNGEAHEAHWSYHEGTVVRSIA